MFDLNGKTALITGATGGIGGAIGGLNGWKMAVTGFEAGAGCTAMALP